MIINASEASPRTEKVNLGIGKEKLAPYET